MKKIIFATGNADKMKEIRKILADLDAEVVSMKEAGIQADIVEAVQKKIEDNKEMLDFLSEALKGRVSKVVISNRLKTHPVCLSAEGNISLEMEKLLNFLYGF